MMSDLPALRLVEGRTVHARFTPFEQTFSYGLFMVDVDIDRMDEAAKTSPLFGIDGPGLYSLRLSEHGDGGDLRGWAEQQLARAGVDANELNIRLVTFPRHAFYRFAPLSVWFARESDGTLRGVVYEVNNTFGESHAYAASVDETAGPVEADKRFHVSPFFDVTGRYRFRLRDGESHLGLVIDSLIDGQRAHTATIAARMRPATTSALAHAAITRPLSAFGVTAGIHFEALKLWLRGAKYRPKPSPPESGPTVAHPVNHEVRDTAA